MVKSILKAMWRPQQMMQWLYPELFVVVQSLSHVWLFLTLWTAARQASLSFIISWSLLKLMFVESVMPSNHLILYHPLLLLPSIFPSIRVFSSEPALHIRWPKDWSFSIRMRVSPLYWISFPFRSSQSPEESPLCYKVGSDSLSTIYIVSIRILIDLSYM